MFFSFRLGRHHHCCWVTDPLHLSFLFLLLEKKGGSNQLVDEYSNSGSARFVQKIHKYWNVRRQMAPAPTVYLSQHLRNMYTKLIFYLCLPCDLFSIMDETEVVRIVESTVSKKNENLLASMKSLLDDSILKRAETFACGHRRFPPQRNQEA